MDDQLAHMLVYRQLRVFLLERARQAASHANSYRYFRVGCAVLACRPRLDYDPLNPPSGVVGLLETPQRVSRWEYNIFLGANLMPQPGGPKVCAEQAALGAAIANGYTRIIALCIAGEPQVDEQSGVEARTLHPCATCRALLVTMPEVTEDTVILTVRNHRWAHEQHSLRELLVRHRGRAA